MFLHLPTQAYIDKVYREWELAGSGRTTSGVVSLMQPWGTSSGLAVARGRCVQYEDRRAAAMAPLPNKESDPEAYQEVVDEAAAAEESASRAARLLGASEANIELARQTGEAILRAGGVDLADAS